MGKSSSSSKKIKSFKDSSKLRSVKKKKTKRNKSKKIRQLKDYSDESGSNSSDSSFNSSSDSEDDYRRQKRRSKVSKKKTSRKRCSSSESDDDDDIRLLKKKKKSKRKGENVGKKMKKKIVSRKRRKRDSSSSSTSSESCSIQDNQSNDGSDSDGTRRTRNRGRLGKVKAARRRSNDESEEDGEPDECGQVDDEVMTEKNSRRLKSIIVVPYTYDNGERKEDMVGDHVNESDERDGEGDDNCRKTVSHDEFEENSKSETSKDFNPENSLKNDNMEVILKKKALENLIRFRRVTQRSGILRKEVSSISEEEPLQITSEKVEKLCVSDGSKDLESSPKILPIYKESGTNLLDSQQNQQSGDTVIVKASSGISSCTTTKRKLIRPVLGQESLNLASRKEAPGAESINGDKNCPESSVALTTRSGGDNLEATEVEKGRSVCEEKKIDETKDESQYQQKTMTVMRGGEMVQVNYKVYIPKKTSSLGRRRQLQR